MKKLLLKKVAVLLVLVSILVSPIHAFASNFDGDIISQMEKEIAIEKEIARREIYRQLKDQDALIMLEVYEDIIYPQIENQIKNEYAVLYNLAIDTVTPYSNSYDAPNGGLVTYLHPMTGYKPTEVAITCLDRDASYDYILEANSLTIRGVLLSILGYIPYIGDISGLVLDIQGIVDGFSISSIKKAGGCAMIMNTYSREFGTKASLVTGWSDRFKIIVPSVATNVRANIF